MWYWNNDRRINEWNRIENLEVDPGIYGQLIHDKGINGKKNRFLTNGNGATG